MRNDFLRQAREDKGWTQQQLAEKMRVGKTTVKSWERGDRFPSLTLRSRLCDLFGMTAEQLGLRSAETSQESMLPTAPADKKRLRILRRLRATWRAGVLRRWYKKHSIQEILIMKKNPGEIMRTVAVFASILSFLILIISLIIPRSYAPPTGILSSPSSTSMSPTPSTKPPVIAITDLGTLDFRSYCPSIGNTSASLDQNNAYGWTCVTSSGNHALIDTDAACRWQYKDPNARSRIVNYSDPNNWHCYSHVKYLGSINFPQYCRSLGEEASLNGNTAYDWRCVVSGSSVLIDTDAACRWQYSEPDALSSLNNYFDPNGWLCFGKA